MNDTERSQWIDNDEWLYNQWRATGMTKRAFIDEYRHNITTYVSTLRNRKPGESTTSIMDKAIIAWFANNEE